MIAAFLFEAIWRKHMPEDRQGRRVHFTADV